MKSAVLVLGAAGFVGMALTKRLIAEGIEVIAAGRGEALAALRPAIHVDDELSSPEAFLHWLPRCRTVVHLASASTPGSSAGKPLFELEHNLRTTFALLEALQAAPHCNLLYVSSGGTLYGDSDVGAVTERHLIRPRSYYGAGKAAAEHFITAWTMQFGAAATILRPSNVYGPGQHARQGFGIIPTAFDAIIDDTPLTIWGDGSTIRDYLFVDDLVELCALILKRPMPSGTLMLNASCGIGLSLNQLLEHIEAVTGRRIVRNYEHQRPVDVSRIVLDASRATRHYGWNASTSIRAGLERTWQWRIGLK